MRTGEDKKQESGKGIGICYRCGYCCRGQVIVPRYAGSDLSPQHLDALTARKGADYTAEYMEENTMFAGDNCPWLETNEDGLTTSCTAYERRSAVCRMHNSDGECLVGMMVMRQYGRLTG